MRKSVIRFMAIPLLAAAIAIPGAAETRASTEKEKIKTIKLTLDLTKPEYGDEVEGDLLGSIFADEDMYVVTGAEYTNDEDEWEYGTSPLLEVNVSVANASEYEFKSGLKASVSSNVSVKNVSVKRDGSDEAVVKIKLKPVAGNIDAPEGIDWEDTYIATWDEVSGAKSYDVKLYRNDSTVTTVNTTHCYYDFYSQMNKTGDYTFKVKAKASKSGDNSDWSDDSDYMEITNSNVTNGATRNINNGYAYNGNSGNRTAGASTYGPAIYGNSGTGTNSAYYMNYSNGLTGGPGVTTYNANPNTYGYTAVNNANSGWRKDANGWQLIYNGDLVTNSWVKNTDGKYYFMDKTGYMLTGWHQASDGFWYFLNPDMNASDCGAMKTGWLNLGSLWYYLEEDPNNEQRRPFGAMVTGDKIIDGKLYHFDTKSGAWFQ